MEFRTIIILIPKKETNVHAYITVLRVLFHFSFPTHLFNFNDRFGVTHDKCMINVTLNVMVCLL